MPESSSVRSIFLDNGVRTGGATFSAPSSPAHVFDLAHNINYVQAQFVASGMPENISGSVTGTYNTFMVDQSGNWTDLTRNGKRPRAGAGRRPDRHRDLPCPGDRQRQRLVDQGRDHHDDRHQRRAGVRRAQLRLRPVVGRRRAFVRAGDDARMAASWPT